MALTTPWPAVILGQSSGARASNEGATTRAPLVTTIGGAFVWAPLGSGLGRAFFLEGVVDGVYTRCDMPEIGRFDPTQQSSAISTLNPDSGTQSARLDHLGSNGVEVIGNPAFHLRIVQPDDDLSGCKLHGRTLL
jgi:hypothetical protein